ncbi:MAG: CCA tRNA nucleotidyltransferase [Anaerolineae bacterium]|nr:CCA tRNA nucleotidyltransferase [Anaerolineae bacterium]
MTVDKLNQAIDTTLYPNRWIAVVRERVIGVGLTRDQAYRAAKNTRPKDKPLLLFVDEQGRLTKPTPEIADWLGRHNLLVKAIDILRRKQIEAYLVGGAVRDLLLGREDVIDFDFVVPGDGLTTARQVANALHAAFYPLDVERGTGRVVYTTAEDKTYLDFASFRGIDLNADLADRDFTINAIALSLADPPHLIDPLNGETDLEQQLIRATSADAFNHDPVRVLRAVRQAIEFDFTVTAETEAALRQAVVRLPNVSPERQRDELMKLLTTSAPGKAIRMLHNYRVLPYLLPELEATVNITQSAPHYQDVFDHTLAALHYWAAKTDLPQQLDGLAADINTYLATELAGDVSVAEMITLSLLLHDTGKALTRTEEEIDEHIKIRFLGHARESAKLARQVMKRLRFSSQATGFVTDVILHHMRPLMLTGGDKLSRRAIYRFFRDTGSVSPEAGVAVALHALIDHQATYPPGQGQAEGEQLLEVVHQLLTAYFERKEQVVDPPPLLTGRDLIDDFGLKEGRIIGLLLRNLKEAQAAGEVDNREAAVAFIKADPNFAHQPPKDL